MEKPEHEHLAAVRLQAVVRGLLARRRVQSLRGEQRLAVISRAITWPSLEERAAVRLQAAGRGFLVRRMVRKMRMLLSPSLQQIAACTFNHSGSPIRPAAPAEVEIWVCGLPVRRMTSTTQHQAPMAMAVSFVLALTLVLGRSSVLVGWYILHSSFHMKLAVGLLPWDPGGHSCSSNLFYILNNKGKPRCERLNPRSRQVGLFVIISRLAIRGYKLGELLLSPCG